ncbi:DNA polymerase phi-domain-containing protein [Syncephalis plumigaleata]|nr:DNA polymerase phi-domain-containing protein [Syncephalis plumigaleata]
MSSTLPLFWDLASLDVKKRESSALSLITELNQCQQTYEVEHASDWSQWLAQEDTVERLEVLCAKDVLYALRRLIRGLPSPRQGARQGFALALTELLSMLHFLSVKTLTSMMLKEMATNSQMSGQEERDMLFGRIFGFMSIAKSTALSRTSTTDEDFSLIVSHLIDYGQQKPFLREVAHQVLVALLPHLVVRPNGTQLVQSVAEQVLAQGLVTPDALMWLLVVEQLASTHNSVPIKKIRALTPDWSSPYLHADNMPRLAILMRESSIADDSISTDLYSVWHPQLHSVWPHLLPWKLFEARWQTLVDHGLFGDGSSHERKYWGFLLMQQAVCNLPTPAITSLFSKRLVQSLTTHLASSDRYLHQCVLSTSRDNTKCTVILQALISHVNVNQPAASKAIDQLTRELDVQGALTYTTYLLERFAQPPVINDKMTLDDKDHLMLMTKSSKLRDDDTIMTLIEDMLMLHGYLEPQEGADSAFIKQTGGVLATPLTDEVRVLCRQKLTRLLISQLLVSSTDTVPRIVTAAQRFNKLLQGEDYAFASDIDEDADRMVLVERVIDQMKSIEKRIKKNKDTAQDAKMRAFEALLGHFVFESICHPLEEESPLVDDMITCFTRLYPEKSKQKESSKKKSKNKNKDEAQPEEMDEPSPIDVFIDGLLSILARPPAPLRDLVKYVFTAFADQVTMHSLHIMLKALQNEDNEDNDEAVEEADEEEEGEDNEAMDEEDDSEDEDDSDISYDSEDNDEKFTLTKEQIHSDLESLGDDDMEPFDRALESMFKEKKAAKNEKKHMTEATLQFKLRIMDLIEIVIRKQSSSALLMELMLPLLSIAQPTNTKSIDAATETLARRATVILGDRLAKLKSPMTGLDTEDDTVDIAKTILFMTTKATASGSFSSLCGRLVAQIVRSLLASDSADAKKQLAKIIQHYSVMLDRFCSDRHTRIMPDLFMELMRRYPVAGWLLVTDRLAHHIEMGDSIKAFRHRQLYAMLTTLIQSTPKGNELAEQHLIKAVPCLQSAFLKDLDHLLAELNSDNGKLGVKTLGVQAKIWIRCLQAFIRRSQSISNDNSVKSLWSTEPWISKLQPLVDQLPGQAMKPLVQQLEK